MEHFFFPTISKDQNIVDYDVGFRLYNWKKNVTSTPHADFEMSLPQAGKTPMSFFFGTCLLFPGMLRKQHTFPVPSGSKTFAEF